MVPFGKSEGVRVEVIVTSDVVLFKLRIESFKVFLKLFKVKKVVSSKKSELFAQYVDAVSDGRILTSDGYYIPLALALSKGIR